ncbi:Squalene epoxidase, partial [Spiromyces aspiralis]
TAPWSEYYNKRRAIVSLQSTADRERILNSEYDVIVVGAGPVGAGLAFGLTRHDYRVLLVEQSWSEPDRIVGELMQPAGYQALCRLGLSDVFRGIGAVEAHGHFVEYKGNGVEIPYNVNAKTGRRFRGVSFHHGRFLQNLRGACQANSLITCLEARVVDLVRDPVSGRVLGVKVGAAGKPGGSVLSDEDQLRVRQGDLPANEDEGEGDTEMMVLASVTCVCDGIFSRLRKLHCTISPDLRSHFVGFVIDHTQLSPRDPSALESGQVDEVFRTNPLPLPQHGHVLLSGRAPVLMYQMSNTETRVLVDIPGVRLPKESTGELRGYLEKIAETIPDWSIDGRPNLRDAYLTALRSTKRIRAIANSFLPPERMRVPGVIFIGDAMNQRHPLTGGGMTAGLWDAVHVCDLLAPSRIPDLRDADRVLKAMTELHWRRKPRTMVINILAMALYTLFAAETEVLESLRAGCFQYFLRGGDCVDHPSGLLSGLL